MYYKFDAFALIIFNKSGDILQNFVLDRNNSKYWWDDFLELQQQYTDAENTEKSLGEVDKAISVYKKEYGADYTILRNSIIGYFRNNDNLNYSDFLSNIIENYTPFNPDFPKNKLIEKLKQLPSNKGFDTQFSIVKGKIKKRISQKIPLANNLFLGIEDYVHNLQNIIEPWKDGQGNKFLGIVKLLYLIDYSASEIKASRNFLTSFLTSSNIFLFF